MNRYGMYTFCLISFFVASAQSGKAPPQDQFTQVQSWKGHTKAIHSVVFSKDAKFLATGGDDSVVKVWRLDGDLKNPLVLRGHEGKIQYLAFSPDGNVLASASSDHTIKIWSGTTKKVHTTLKGVSGPLVFGPDGKTLAAVKDDGVVLWNTVNWKERTRLSWQLVHSLAFSEDGKFLAYGGMSFTERNGFMLKLWDVVKEEELATLSPGEAVLSLAFSPNGKSLVFATGGQEGPPETMIAPLPWFPGSLCLWDLEDKKKELAKFGRVFANRHKVAFSADGKRLVSFHDSPMPGLEKQMLPAPDWLTPAEWGKIEVWDMVSKKAYPFPLKIRKTRGTTPGALTSDGSHLALGYSEGTIELWHVPTMILKK
jgi:WD40 repeat protein